MTAALKTIEQSVRFPASARELYDLYIDPELHAAFTGAPVTIGAAPGSPFAAFGGMLEGAMLHTAPGQLVVQRWRSSQWKVSDIDSTLVLRFVQDGDQGRIDLVHVNVPAHDYAGVTEGWGKYYWEPLRQYLKWRKTK